MNRDPKNHVTDEEAFGLVMDNMLEADLKEIQQHLDSCQECARRVKELEDPEGFPHKQWAAHREHFVSSLRERIFGQVIAVWPRVALSMAAATASRQKGERETEDGTLRWVREENEKGDLVAWLASHALELKGREIRLRVKDFERCVGLKQVAPDQVGAKVVFSPAERKKWPENAELEISLLPESHNKPGQGEGD